MLRDGHLSVHCPVVRISSGSHAWTLMNANPGLHSRIQPWGNRRQRVRPEAALGPFVVCLRVITSARLRWLP